MSTSVPCMHVELTRQLLWRQSSPSTFVWILEISLRLSSFHGMCLYPATPPTLLWRQDPLLTWSLQPWLVSKPPRIHMNPFPSRRSCRYIPPCPAFAWCWRTKLRSSWLNFTNWAASPTSSLPPLCKVEVSYTSLLAITVGNNISKLCCLKSSVT